MSSERRSIIPGVLLVAIGGLIILNKLDVFGFRFRDIFPYAIIALGIWFFYKLLVRHQRGAAFPATFFTLLGLFFLFRQHSYHFWRLHYIEDFWPVFLLILGIAFLIQFLVRPKDWGLLIPSIILLCLGCAFLFRNMGWYYFYDFEYYVQQYWPLVLVFIGLLLILTNIRRKAGSG